MISVLVSPFLATRLAGAHPSTSVTPSPEVDVSESWFPSLRSRRTQADAVLATWSHGFPGTHARQRPRPKRGLTTELQIPVAGTWSSGPRPCAGASGRASADRRLSRKASMGYNGREALAVPAT
jgi:hypothetical protein